MGGKNPTITIDMNDVNGTCPPLLKARPEGGGDGRGAGAAPGWGGLARTEILTLRLSLELLGAAELRATIERRTWLSPFDPRPSVLLVL
jgi:hypothetical protein